MFKKKGVINLLTKMNNRKHLIFLIGIAVTFSGCMQFRTSPKGVMEEFEESSNKPIVKDIKEGDRNLRYVEVADGKHIKPTIFFIHGAPGSSDNFFNFMKDENLVARFDMVSVDRPGYGYSDFGKSETSIKKQAEALYPILKEYKNTPTLLVGHSYGGPVAAKTAVLYPGMVQGIMLLAPAIDPQHEKKFAIAWFGKAKPFRWLTPKSWKVATDEKYSHVEELKKMLPDWEKIKVPVTYIQGDEDSLVPYENLAFAEKMIDSSCLKVIGIPGEDHFLPWSQEELVTSEIFSLETRVERTKGTIACTDEN